MPVPDRMSRGSLRSEEYWPEIARCLGLRSPLTGPGQGRAGEPLWGLPPRPPSGRGATGPSTRELHRFSRPLASAVGEAEEVPDGGEQGVGLVAGRRGGGRWRSGGRRGGGGGTGSGGGGRSGRSPPAVPSSRPGQRGEEGLQLAEADGVGVVAPDRPRHRRRSCAWIGGVTGRLPHDREGRAVLDAGREEEGEVSRDIDHGSLRGHRARSTGQGAGCPAANWAFVREPQLYPRVDGLRQCDVRRFRLRAVAAKRPVGRPTAESWRTPNVVRPVVKGRHEVSEADPGLGLMLYGMVVRTEVRAALRAS